MAITLRTFGNVTGTNPIITVPAGEYWSVKTLRIDYTADATAGTRTLTLVMDNGAGAGTFWQSPFDNGQNPSASCQYMFGVRSGALNYPLIGDGSRTYPLLPVILAPGWRIRTDVINIAGGDTFTNMTGVIDIESGEYLLRYGTTIKLES